MSVHRTKTQLLGADLYHQAARASHTSLSSSCYDDDLTDMEESCVIEEAVVMDAKEVSKQDITLTTPPALPQRSSLRSSRLLDSMKFRSIESASQSIKTSHDVYMSSEEDVSSSADDFSVEDYDFDSASESGGSERSLSSRKSHEDTARVVSVVFVGKPNVIELNGGRRSVSPPTTEKSAAPKLRPLETRAMSTLQKRQSSISTLSSRRPKPAFLNTDPFAGQAYNPDTSRGNDNDTRPPTPKNPTAVFNRFQKSLGLARKRSRPNLKEASRESVIMTADLPSLSTSPTETQEPVSASPSTPQTPVTYQEIVRAARKNSVSYLPPMRSETQSPISPDTGKKGILSGLNASRRKSLRL